MPELAQVPELLTCDLDHDLDAELALLCADETDAGYFTRELFAPIAGPPSFLASLLALPELDLSDVDVSGLVAAGLESADFAAAVAGSWSRLNSDNVIDVTVLAGRVAAWASARNGARSISSSAALAVTVGMAL